MYEATRIPPWNESIEAMLMILPPRPVRSMCRAAACARKKTDFRFTFITASQSASVKSSASARRMMPALFTRMSTRAGVLQHFLHDIARVRACAEIGLDGVELAARSQHGRAGFIRRRAAHSNDVRAGPRQGNGDGLPDAGVGAGDQRGAAVKIEEIGHGEPRARVPRSPQRRSGDHVHVLVVLVVAGHRPDERVAAGAGAHVNGPRRRDHGLLVRHDDVPRFRAAGP